MQKKGMKGKELTQKNIAKKKEGSGELFLSCGLTLLNN